MNDAIQRGGLESTGVSGLDDILGGGLTADRLYLIEGTPGTGKTTFALRFLLAGAEAGESGLYITLSETADELRAVVAAHGWSLDGLDIFELIPDDQLTPELEQSIFHPSEVEFGETIRSFMAEIERRKPKRVVIDSLSEIRLLAQDALRYRRQILALKQFFAHRACTVLLLDDKTAEPTDLQLHSISHGVISLEQSLQEFGTERRRLRVIKLRGQKFQGGLHDFVLDTGRVDVFPRLVALDHQKPVDHVPLSTGCVPLDEMMGGGLAPGTNTLFMGPAGIGKTTTVMVCLAAALKRGERVAYYLFDEGLSTFVARSASLGMEMAPYIASGQLIISRVDPAERSPGEFAISVIRAVKEFRATFVAIDSLNAYMLAMPGQSFLLLHMHELLTFLNHQGVTTVTVVSQHGVVDDVRSEVDMSYLCDASVLFKFFEANGEVHAAVTAVKSRTFANQRTIREFRVIAGPGIEIGPPLTAFEGILGGLPTYSGSTRMLADEAPS